MNTCTAMKQHLAEHHVDAGTDKELGHLWSLLENSEHGCGECPHATDCIGAGGVAPPQKCPHEFCGWRRRLAQAKANVDAGTIADGRQVMDHADNQPEPDAEATAQAEIAELKGTIRIMRAGIFATIADLRNTASKGEADAVENQSPPENPPLAAAEATARETDGVAEPATHETIATGPHCSEWVEWVKIQYRLTNWTEQLCDNHPEVEEKLRAIHKGVFKLMVRIVEDIGLACTGETMPEPKSVPLDLWKAANEFGRAIRPENSQDAATIRNRLLAVLAAFTEVTDAS